MQYEFFYSNKYQNPDERFANPLPDESTTLYYRKNGGSWQKWRGDHTKTIDLVGGFDNFLECVLLARKNIGYKD